MATLLYLVMLVSGLASLVLFIMILMKMFQNQQTGMAILTIVLAFACGIGAFVALVIGWMNAKAWNIQNLMLGYSIALAIYVVSMMMYATTGGGPAVPMP